MGGKTFLGQHPGEAAPSTPGRAEEEEGAEATASRSVRLIKVPLAPRHVHHLTEAGEEKTGAIVVQPVGEQPTEATQTRETGA